MLANKNNDEQTTVNIIININSVNVQENVGASNNQLTAGEESKKSSVFKVLARIGSFIKGLITSIIRFMFQPLI